MAGRKRAATDDTAGGEKRETRSSKVQKSEGGGRAASGRGGAKGTARLKTGLSTAAFKARAAPLHLALSYDPFPGEGEVGATAAATTSASGERVVLLTTTTLTPGSFATGSFGWKGSKRIVVGLKSKEQAEGEATAEVGEETLNVMLTINATVIGSKGTKEIEEEGKGEKEGAGEGEGAHEEGRGEAKPAVEGDETEASAAEAQGEQTAAQVAETTTETT
ncbi:hypothetical protein V8B97DRAFT_2004929 [Scleroderma yunnanense]